MKGPRRSNLVYPTMGIAQEGLASLAVDLHEVGALLILTNSLVQLHYLDGGSQVTPNQSRRHHSPRRGCSVCTFQSLKILGWGF